MLKKLIISWFIVLVSSHIYSCTFMLSSHEKQQHISRTATPLPKDLRNQLLLTYGLNILATVGHIVLTKEDRKIAAQQNIGVMVQNVADFIQTVVRAA